MSSYKISFGIKEGSFVIKYDSGDKTILKLRRGFTTFMLLFFINLLK